MSTVTTVCTFVLLSCATMAQTDSTKILTKSPTTAVLYSLALPGLGQVYTESYWKVPLFTGTCAIAAWQFFRNNADFQATSQQYDAAVAAGETALFTATS